MLIALVATAVIVVSAPAANASEPVSAAPPPGATDLGTMAISRIIARHSGKCVTVHGNSTVNGAVVDQYTCVGQSNQYWNRLQDTTVLSYFIAENSGKCMDVRGGGTANGTPLVQWTCNSRNNQRFFVWHESNGYFRIQPGHASSKCLDVPGGSLSNNVQIVIWTCNGATNQQFRLA